mgnify:CR=1 FL=1
MMDLLKFMKYFLDLFSGIGGFALGAYWAGLRFDGHYFSEVDNYAIRVYQQRFPDAIGLGDIRKIRGQDLPKGDWITCGGFPCQDISVAGKGVGLAGERSGLWFEYARLIGEIQPQYAIMENVGALSFRGLDAVLGSLAEIGYDAEWCDIRASDIGAPHRRERLWIVAYPNGSRLEKHGLFKSDLSIGSGETRTSNKPEESENDVGYPHSVRMERQGAKFQTARTGRTGKDVADTSSKRLEGWEKAVQLEKGWHSDTGYDRKKIGSSWRNSQWDSEPDVGRVANGVPSRVDRLKCLGNSIVPQIAELIFEQAVFDLWRTV